MKKNRTKLLSHFLSFVFLFALMSLSVAYAQNTGNTLGGATPTIKNPLATDDLEGLLKKVLNIVTVFGSLVVVFFIIYSGFKFVTAQGDTNKIKEAREMFYATVIGAAILLGANLIATVVLETVKATTGLKIKQ